MIDMHGTVSPGGSLNGYPIVCGVAGHSADVDSHFYDTAFLLDNGKLIMETDLDLNSHKLLNYTPISE